MNKSQIRQQLKARRADINDEQRLQAHAKIIHNITTSTFWQQAESVAIYLAFGHEVDISELLKSNKKMYVPAIKGTDMQFQAFNAQLEIETLSYGLRQPRFDENLTAADIDLYLMPLLGFDSHGNRLGMGGGFYDRYFAEHHAGIRAGVAYQCQQVEQLPCEPWDVKIQHIFTEQQSQTI